MFGNNKGKKIMTTTKTRLMLISIRMVMTAIKAQMMMAAITSK